HVQGVDGGHPSFLDCSDGETVTAEGLANGFTQPGPMGCWTHQAYDQAFFGPLGFTKSFFDAPPEANLTSGPGEGPWSSLLSSGLTVVGAGPGPVAVPEPSMLLLFWTALIGFGFRLRRSR